MDEQTQKAHAELIDTLGARADELERRLDALLDLMRREPVQQALGLRDFDFLLTAPTKSPLEVRTMKQTHARETAVAKLRQDEVLERLAQVSPARLDALLRER